MKVIKAEDTRSLEPFRDRIIEGDCLEVMKSIPGESIDMILCDLPYGTTQNKWDSIIDLDLLFTEYMRIIKPHGAIVLTSSGLFTAKLMLHAPEIYKYKLVWVKSKATNFLNAKKQPLRKYEDICVLGLAGRGELLLGLRYLRNYSRIKGKDVIGELLLSLWYLRN